MHTCSNPIPHWAVVTTNQRVRQTQTHSLSESGAWKDPSEVDFVLHFHAASSLPASTPAGNHRPFLGQPPSFCHGGQTDPWPNQRGGPPNMYTPSPGHTAALTVSESGRFGAVQCQRGAHPGLFLAVLCPPGPVPAWDLTC